MKNMLRAISENGGVVICALNSTNMVKTMEELHRPSAVVSAALGRLLTAASLMGSWLKSADDSITLRVDGKGPIGPMVAVSDGYSNVRGYAVNKLVEIPLRSDGKLNVGGAVGTNGNLSVVRNMGLKEPYMGQVPLVSGEIGEDITAYYAASEQTPSVCSLGVLVDKDLSILQAGGFLLQLLPGATEEEISLLERNISHMPAVTDLLAQGGTPLDMAEMMLKGFNPNVLDEQQVHYRCSCSEERTRGVLASLGSAELHRLHKEEPKVDVECHFCDKTYSFEKADIERIISEACEG